MVQVHLKYHVKFVTKSQEWLRDKAHSRILTEMMESGNKKRHLTTNNSLKYLPIGICINILNNNVQPGSTPIGCLVTIETDYNKP